MFMVAIQFFVRVEMGSVMSCVAVYIIYSVILDSVVFELLTFLTSKTLSLWFRIAKCVHDLFSNILRP